MGDYDDMRSVRKRWLERQRDLQNIAGGLGGGGDSSDPAPTEPPEVGPRRGGRAKRFVKRALYTALAVWVLAHVVAIIQSHFHVAQTVEDLER